MNQALSTSVELAIDQAEEVRLCSSGADLRPLRVLAITPELPRADQPGSNAPLLRQVESLRARGHQVDVIDMHGPSMFKYPLTLPKVRSLASRADLVHGHFGFCAWLGRAQWRKPLVVSFMGDDLLGEPTDDGSLTRFSRLMVEANRRLARLASAVIVKSAEMARVVAPVHAHVIPNGVDTQTFQPAPIAAARKQLGWDSDERVVLFPGNPENPRKGIELARAAMSVAERQLKAAIRLQPMWGIAPADVPTYMNACNAMWMTSMIEGSPNVVKEALACDRPIVAVPVGDVEDILAGVEGCQVEARDAEALGRAMAETIVNHRESAGRAALRRMRLDLDSVAQRVEAVYAGVLGTGEGR